MKSVSSGPGDEPLLAVEDVLAGRRVADGRRREGPGVGAGAVLGDRVAAVALAAQAGVEVAPPLLRVGSGSARCRRPGCTTTGRRSTWPSCSWTRTCSRTVQPWPPTSRGKRAAVQAGLDRGAPDRRCPSRAGRGRRRARTRPRAAGARRGRTRAPGPGARAARRQGEVHRRKDAARGRRRGPPVAGREPASRATGISARGSGTRSARTRSREHHPIPLMRACPGASLGICRTVARLGEPPSRDQDDVRRKLTATRPGK